MSNDDTAVPRLVAIDRRQLILRTMDVEKLVEPEHCVRSIWELVGRLDLRLYYAQIAAVEGSAGREHTDPQLLISLWLYAYSGGGSFGGGAGGRGGKETRGRGAGGVVGGG